jgi:uncharacterized protein YndB with AHSA1/START domain
MTGIPTARLFGTDLELTRSFRAPAEDVWASVTEPDRTARWFGPWEGDAAPGRMIKVQMAFEEPTGWMDMRIDACEPPQRLALSAHDENGNWRIELLVTERDGVTELRFVHHMENTDGIGSIGPGWEYYLDMLVATHTGGPTPDFDDYYPAQKAYYESLG